MLQPLAGGCCGAQQQHSPHVDIFPFVGLTISDVHVQSLHPTHTSIAQCIIAVRVPTELHSNFDHVICSR